MIAETEFVVPEVIAFPDGHAVVALDVRILGKVPHLTPDQADRLVAKLMVCSQRAREMDSASGG